MTTPDPNPDSSRGRSPRGAVGRQHSNRLTRQAIAHAHVRLTWPRTAAAWLAVTATCGWAKVATLTWRVWLSAVGRVRAVRASPADRSVRQAVFRCWEMVAPFVSWCVEMVRAVVPGVRRTAGRHRLAGRPVTAQAKVLRIGVSAVGVVALTVGAVAAAVRHATPTASEAAVGLLHGQAGTGGGSSGDTTRSPDPRAGSAAQSTVKPAAPRTPDATTEAPSNSTGDSQPSHAPSDSGPVHEAGPEYGVDVSNHNGDVNWKDVAANGKRFAFVEATDGEGFTNPLFRSQFGGAKDAGLLVGAYHFARPSGSPSDQADFLLSTIKYRADGQTLPPVLDLEVNPVDGGCYGLSDNEMRDWVTAFSSRVRDATGTDVILYANAAFWNQCTGDTDAFKSTNPLSLAAYGFGAPVPPGGWDHYTFWQNSESGHVNGVDGNVDLDVFNGSLDQLRKFTKKGN